MFSFLFFCFVSFLLSVEPCCIYCLIFTAKACTWHLDHPFLDSRVTQVAAVTCHNSIISLTYREGKKINKGQMGKKCSLSCPQFVKPSLCFHLFQRMRRRSKNIMSTRYRFPHLNKWTPMSALLLNMLKDISTLKKKLCPLCKQSEI